MSAPGEHIDALIRLITRQAMKLVARLAIVHDRRSSLAKISDIAFLELNNELETLGLRKKVIADMFGLALRSYQQKVNRLHESTAWDMRSLWTSVYDYLSKAKKATRKDIFDRYNAADERVLSSILADLTASGFLTKTDVKTTKGGNDTIYTVTDDNMANKPTLNQACTLNLVWTYIYTYPRVSRQNIAERLGLDADAVQSVLEQLEKTNRIERVVDDLGEYFVAPWCIQEAGEGVMGMLSGMYHHFQSICSALAIKLEQTIDTSAIASVNESSSDQKKNERRSITTLIGQATTGTADLNTDSTATLRPPDDRTPLTPKSPTGSTYSFDIWDAHPHAKQVLEFLARTRKTLSGLRKDIEAHRVSLVDEGHYPKDISPSRITIYIGQYEQFHE